MFILPAMAFFQDPPSLGNQYDDDAQLREYPQIRHAIPPQMRDELHALVVDALAQ